MIDLSVIIVNYNNDRVLRGCLPALADGLTGIRAEVVISDNGSTDGSLEWIRGEYPAIRVLQNGANLGFAEANNRAFAVARGRYVLLLNPDTIVQEDALAAMLSFLERNDSAGVVGCKLLNGDGSRQISARKFPTILTYFLHFSGLAYRFPASRFFGQFKMTDWDGETQKRVDWVSGAALMTRREVLERVGALDPCFFLTYDEVDWCRRVRDAGYEVWYTPEGRIVHLDRQSEPQSNPAPESRIKYLTVERNSRARYFVKHHGVVYAVIVESLHLVFSTLLLMKARLLGTSQPAITTLERRLMLRLYWNTLLRVPGLCRARLARSNAEARNSPHSQLFVNPYEADAS